MHHRLLMIAALTPALLSACVIDARRRDTTIGPERVVDIPIPRDAVVDLRIPAGSVRITGVSGDRMNARMNVLCPDLDSRCAERLADLEWVSSIEGAHVILRTNHNGAMAYRDAEARIEIDLPAVHSVHVDMSAGELSIDRLQGCLTVDMGAGDVDASLPIEQVAGVHLDAGVGDASMAVGGRHRSASRSWLIGAELDWHDGRGHCQVDVDLQAGDIFVELTEG